MSMVPDPDRIRAWLKLQRRIEWWHRNENRVLTTLTLSCMAGLILLMSLPR